MRRLAALVVVVGSAVATVGCTHPLEFKRYGEWDEPVRQGPGRDITLGIVPLKAGGGTHQLVEAVMTKLKAMPQIMVIEGWEPGPGAQNVDAILEIKISPSYEGSAANFFIGVFGSWILMPAWHGFVYYANLETAVSVEVPGGGRQEATFPCVYQINHCDLERGAVVELGMFLTYGLVGIPASIIATGYDTDVTNPFIQQVQEDYATFAVYKVIALMRGVLK